MNKYSQGLTLTELLVSTILIGIVMLGVVGFSLTIKQLQDSASRTTIMRMRLASAMDMLVKDAKLAVGDTLDPGIATYQNLTDQSICFRHDVSDPSSYTDDTWICYYHDSSYKLYRYVGTSSANVPCTSSATCSAGTTAIEHVIDLLHEGNGEFFQFLSDGSIEFTIKTSYDPTKPSHPIDNPEYSLTTTVMPIGQASFVGP